MWEILAYSRKHTKLIQLQEEKWKGAQVVGLGHIIPGKGVEILVSDKLWAEMWNGQISALERSWFPLKFRGCWVRRPWNKQSFERYHVRCVLWVQSCALKTSWCPNPQYLTRWSYLETESLQKEPSYGELSRVLNQYDWWPYDRRKQTMQSAMWPRRQRRVMLLQAEGCQPPPEAERQGRLFPWSLQRQRGPAHALILDFKPPELWEKTLLV